LRRSETTREQKTGDSLPGEALKERRREDRKTEGKKFRILGRYALGSLMVFFLTTVFLCVLCLALSEASAESKGALCGEIAASIASESDWK
jgi:hypothetical protein